MLAWVIKVAASYLLGSILGSLFLARVMGRPDIRTVGSGNPGSTNALRTQGKRFALGVMAIDAGKGWLAAAVVPTLFTPLGAGPAVAHAWLPVACGAAVMLGHVYPAWYGLRGGKAVATYVGVLLGLAPLLLLAVLLAWLAVVVLTGFVGLASMLATLVLPLWAAWNGPVAHRPLLAFGVFATVLILYTHRSNIARMCTGHEPRARRLWLLGRVLSRS